MTSPVQWLLQITERTSLWKAVKDVALYRALRGWAVVMNCFPINVNLGTARTCGRIWWLLRRKNRATAMSNLRAAFGTQYSERELRQIGIASFEHWAQVYLVELMMTPRLINVASWSRYVELANVGPALRELLRPDRGVVLVSPHLGNFELMGYTIATIGLPISAVMRPLDYPLITRFLKRTRETHGVTLVDKFGASNEFGQVLENRGALGLIADQYGGTKGVFVDFFGRKASVYKSIGLAAIYYNVPIVVGAAIRTRRAFHYRIEIERIIQPEEWSAQDNPLLWVTAEFTTAFERCIRRAPEQYLWVHDRWKTRSPRRRTSERRAGATDLPVSDTQAPPAK